jgi:hypothetical protein
LEKVLQKESQPSPKSLSIATPSAFRATPNPVLQNLQNLAQDPSLLDASVTSDPMNPNEDSSHEQASRAQH